MLYHIENIKKLLLKGNININNPSVLTGDMGKALFLCEYDIYKRQNVHQKDVNIIVSKQIDLINTTRISNHSIDGLVGFVHGMSFLFGKNIIEVIDENDFFSEVDPFLIALSNEYLRKNEFDSFDGFIGIANMMLERVKKTLNLSQ